MTNVIAIGLFIIGLFLFGLPAVLSSRPAAAMTLNIGLPELLIVLGLVLVLLLLHEALHWLAMWHFGARPYFGVGLMGRTLPVLYVGSPEHRYSRRQYVVVAAAPCVLISSVGVVACLSPLATYLVLPLAAHLAACIGDAMAIWQVLRQPAGTEVENLLPGGLRFHRPLP